MNFMPVTLDALLGDCENHLRNVKTATRSCSSLAFWKEEMYLEEHAMVAVHLTGGTRSVPGSVMWCRVKVVSFEVEVLNHDPEDAVKTCTYPFSLLLQNASLENHYTRSDQRGLQIWARPSV
jgi:hypothetical protein